MKIVFYFKFLTFINLIVCDNFYRSVICFICQSSVVLSMPLFTWLSLFGTVLRIRILRTRMFLGLLDDPDSLVRGTDPDPDPSIIKQK